MKKEPIEILELRHKGLRDHLSVWTPWLLVGITVKNVTGKQLAIRRPCGPAEERWGLWALTQPDSRATHMG